MMLRNIFILMSLLIVLVAGYGNPRIQMDGHSVAASSSMGYAVRQAINLALGALVRKIKESPGQVVTADDFYADYKVTALYSPSLSYLPETDSNPPSGTQLANGIYKLVEPSASWIWERGYCSLQTDSDCTTGIMSYHVVNFKSELKKRSDPNFANSSFTTGIHYLPINETVHAKIMPRPRLSNARVSLCKRNDNPSMTRCASMDTLIAGYPMKSGNALYSSNGFKMEFQSDRNICTTDPNGHKYWCMMTQVGMSGTRPSEVPFTMIIGNDARLRFEDKNRNFNYEPDFLLRGQFGHPDYQYRLTMQNDGNLVLYRGMDNTYAIWASHPGQSPYPGTVDKPCTGKFLL
jgi:hypothetical protein